MSKKYASVKNDLSTLIIALIKSPEHGVSLGSNLFKIRIAIASKNKGKSGGARVITYVKVVDEIIYLVSIYDKSETETISADDLLKRVKNL